MKVIIDPYRGGPDTGEIINGQYEKNLLLNLSKYMLNDFEKNNIDAELTRTTDTSLTDDERTSIINELKTENDIIVQNRYSDDGLFNIIYPLRNSDSLASQISTNLEKNNINVDKYFQRRLPTDTSLDYYSIIRNTKPNQVIIIEYNDLEDYQNTVNTIVNTIIEYLNKANTYTVQSGDSLYQIAKKYNTTVDELKALNNLTSNSLSIGQKLKIPTKTASEENYKTYTVKKGDSLYQIAKKYDTTVSELKTLNNLTSNSLSIGQKLKIPTKTASEENYETYTVKKGDSLYQIAKKYDTTVSELKTLNNLTNNLLNIGDKIKVPTTKSQYIIYTVQSGDSLYQIAKKNNTTVDEIKKINNLTSNLLGVGQKLNLPR